MLALSRKPGQSLVIGDNIKITIVAVEGSVVKIAVDAPKEIPVHRFEVFEAIARENSRAARADVADAEKLAEALEF